MKNSIKTLVAIAILAIASNVFAQAVTADGVIKTCTICPISIVHDVNAALNFGTLINMNTAVAQTMTVNPDGTFATGSADLIVYHGSNTHDEPAADHFTLGGTSGYHFDLRVPNWETPEPIAIPGGGSVTLTTNMPLESDRQFPGLETAMECVNMQLYVGGTFTIPAGGVAPGDASTPYRVQIQYN